MRVRARVHSVWRVKVLGILKSGIFTMFAFFTVYQLGGFAVALGRELSSLVALAVGTQMRGISLFPLVP